MDPSSGSGANGISKSELKTQELVVGARGFEPRTSCAQGRRATRLRYAPTEFTPSILVQFSAIPLLRFLSHAFVRQPSARQPCPPARAPAARWLSASPAVSNGVGKFSRNFLAPRAILRRMKISSPKIQRTLFASLLCLPALVALAANSQDKSPSPGQPAWTLSWSDEFNAPDGSRPDSSKWKFVTGGNGWGNHELEYYTDRPENSSVQGGHLVIQAAKENFTGPDRVSREFTSARLSTRGLFEQAYGRFEARVKIPKGQGIWPAFWLLGNNIAAARWPDCGEIDIMENIGKEPATIHGSMHGPGYSGEQAYTSLYRLPGDVRFSDDFHLFAVEWQPLLVRFYVDQELYASFTPARLPPGAAWVFDHPFFIVLNVAVGGDWPGPPDASTLFPQSMLVDYVRVYKLPDAK